MAMDHVEYELLVVSVFPEPVTLSSVTVLDPAGKELMRIEGDGLTAATQTLFAHTEEFFGPHAGIERTPAGKMVSRTTGALPLGLAIFAGSPPSGGVKIRALMRIRR